jgi:hypothetical protein
MFRERIEKATTRRELSRLLLEIRDRDTCNTNRALDQSKLLCGQKLRSLRDEFGFYS